MGGKRCKLVRKVTTTKPRKIGICISIPRPLNGYMRCTRKKIYGRFPLGTKCKLKCRKGYEPSAYMRKKCTEGGAWVGSDASCKEEVKVTTTTTQATTTTVRFFHCKYFLSDLDKIYYSSLVSNFRLYQVLALDYPH